MRKRPRPPRRKKLKKKNKNKEAVDINSFFSSRQYDRRINMLTTIKNGSLTVTADTFGAELHSFRIGGTEYLWQCGDAWKRYAPILFPFICSPKDKTYRAGGKEYRMPSNHGFARDSEFTLSHKDDRSMTFTLTSSEKTMEVYPYRFELSVKYELISEDSLKETVTVTNTDSGDIFFYLGGHPAFNCPLEKDLSFSDCYVQYSSPETIVQVWNGTRTILENSDRLDLTRALFDNDVIMKDKPVSRSVTLRSGKGSKGVELSWLEGVDCISVWSPTGNDEASFVCLEPWSSVPVYEDDAYPDIENKPHAVKLGKGEKFTQSYVIRGF